MTNTGNASVSNVVIADGKCAATPALTSGDGNGDNRLNANETWTYTCTSVNVTQDEIDDGSIDNTVTVNGTGADGAPVAPASDTLQTPVKPAPAFSLLKSTTDTPTREGDRLTYEFALSNDGNVTIFGPTLSDPKCASGFTPVSGDSDGDGALDVGDTHNYTCLSVPVTQTEVDAGAVNNTATVTGSPAGGSLGPQSASNTTPIAPDPELTLDKRLSAAPPTSYSSTSDVILYDFVVTNTGNVTLTGTITINDLQLDAPANCLGFPAGGLPSGDSITCTGSHTITQPDIDNGPLINTATAFSGGTTSNSDTVTVPVDQNPALGITKTAQPLSADFDEAGDIITYEYVVQNTGGASFVDVVTVSDNKINNGTPFTRWAPNDASGNGVNFDPDPNYPGVPFPGTPTNTNGETATCEAD